MISIWFGSSTLEQLPHEVERCVGRRALFAERSAKEAAERAATEREGAFEVAAGGVVPPPLPLPPPG